MTSKNIKLASGPFEVVGNGSRLLVESEQAPPGHVARFQALDPFGQLAEIHRKTKLNNWWYACASISSFLGLLTGIYSVELADFEHRHQGDALPFLGAGLMHFCIVGSTLLCICALAVYYDGLAYLQQIKGVYVPKQASLFTRLRRVGLLDACFWDMAAQMVLPWPFFNLDQMDVFIFNGGLNLYSRYSVRDLLVLGMFLRLRLLPRFCALFHQLNSADTVFYGKLLSMEVNTSMISKVLVSESVWFLAGAWTLAILVFSYPIYIFERDVQEELPQHATSHISSCIWLTLTTMTTIGYGDVYPITRLGRVTAVLSCFVAVVLFAITLTWFIKAMSLDSNEDAMVRVLRKVHARRAVQHAAVRVIECVYRRSPMYERFRLHKERVRRQAYQHEYEDVAALEQRNIEVFGGQIEMDAKPSQIYYGSGRFNRDELLNLREALNDRQTMENIKRFSEARQQLTFLTRSQELDKRWQVGELMDTQFRLKKSLKDLSAQSRQFSKLIKQQEDWST